MHALAALLLTIHGRCGEDKQREIMTLLPIINGLCQPEAPKPETVSETTSPAPPVNPIQSMKTPVGERTPTVFISYSHVDKAIAEKLIADLGRAGHACWIDKVEIKGGDEWMQSITEGINNSYAFISLVSDDANRSTWVRREFLWAEHKKKPIYPVQVAPCELPIYMVERQVSDVQNDYAAGFAVLLASLPAPRIVSPEVDDAEALKTVFRTESRPVIRRELELAYMDRLRFEEFQVEKYVALSGDAHLAPKARRAAERLALHPDLIRQEFAHTPWAREGKRETRHFEDAVSELLAIRRAVVLGEPGAGKTTTLWRLARSLYDVAQKNLSAPLPLLIKLGKWTDDTQTLSHFIAAELGELGMHLDALLHENRAALLLDGLNEIPAAQHKRKFEQVAALIRQYPDVLAVITCRKQDYTIDLHFDQIEITPLDPLRISEFVVRSLGEQDGGILFWKLAGESAQKQEKLFCKEFSAQRTDWKRLFWLAERLPADLHWSSIWRFSNDLWTHWLHERNNPSSLMVLARNPYMLRMLAEVYVDRDNDLPSNRGELFKSFVERLLMREGIAQRDNASHQVILTKEAESLLSGLAQLALEMQFRRVRYMFSTEVNAGTSLELANVRRILSERLLYLAVSTSILNSGDKISFSHQLLQEYFAALAIDREIRKGRLLVTDLWRQSHWWRRTNWEETAILLAGLYSDDCTPVLDWLANANPELAAQCITRSGAHTPDSTKIRLRDQWLLRLTDLKLDPQPQARAGVGRALGSFQIGGRMADNRRGVGLRADGLPDLDWVEIPAGEFDYGHEDEFRNPPKRLSLLRFLMTRYLITYEQFGAFLAVSDGFYNPKWWEGLAADDEHKAQPRAQAFKYGNHPRESVSWYDAVAFTRWLSAKLGYKVTIPTEQQYERAARWTDGRLYSYAGAYDPAKANTYETGIRQTSPVGIFPNGVSVEGIHDLCGNVWEWCLNEYNRPEHTAEVGKASRVLRGGSFHNGQDLSRAVCRGGFPLEPSSSYGFRLVTSGEL